MSEPDNTKVAQNLNSAQANLFRVVIQPRRTDDADADFQVAPIIFRTKKVPVPGVDLPVVSIPNRVAPFSLPAGGKAVHPAEIEITLELDDKLQNYFALIKWADSIAKNAKTKGDFDTSYLKDVKPGNDQGEDKVSPVQFSGKVVKPTLTLQELHVNQGKNEWIDIDYRDIVISLHDTNHIPFASVCYREVFPISIPSFDFLTTSSDRIEIPVTFGYVYHEFVNTDGTLIV
jgi:hypothetical protein